MNLSEADKEALINAGRRYLPRLQTKAQMTTGPSNKVPAGAINIEIITKKVDNTQINAKKRNNPKQPQQLKRQAKLSIYELQVKKQQILGEQIKKKKRLQLSNASNWNRKIRKCRSNYSCSNKF